MLLSNKIPFPEMPGNSDSRGWCRYCSPQGFFPLTTAPIPWLAGAALVACALGLYLGLAVALVDLRQGEAARIAFIHVPASRLSMFVYLLAAIAAGVGLVWKNARLAPMVALALAPTGLLMAFLSLWTSSLWSKSILGIWWATDVHTLSELAMVLFFLAFIGVDAVLESRQRANTVGALLLMAGLVSIPVHLATAPAGAGGHLATSGIADIASFSIGESASLIAMSFGFLFYAGAAVLLRLRCVILENERESDWVARYGRGGR